MRLLFSILLVTCGTVIGAAYDKLHFPKEYHCETSEYGLCNDLHKVFSHVVIPTINQLFELDKDSEIYRFFWNRSFHKPIAFQLAKKADGTTTLVIAIFDRSQENLAYEKHQIELSEADSDRINQLTKRAFSWSENNKIPIQNRMKDGAEWCFNILYEQMYFAHCRQSPQPMPFNDIPERLKHHMPDWRLPDADFHALGMEIIKLSKMDFGPIY